VHSSDRGQEKTKIYTRSDKCLGAALPSGGWLASRRLAKVTDSEEPAK